jgi:hydrogenase maturation factor HypF (carbamoyltransferase family)
MTTTPTYVGIDVAKNRLDIAMRPSGECQQVGNDERGIRYPFLACARCVPRLSSSKRPAV